MIPRVVKENLIYQNIKTLIIDDCYPVPLESPASGIDVVRITTDIKWNQSGARNLGFHLLNGWVLCSDIDHVVTTNVINQIKQLNLDPDVVYFLGRKCVLPIDRKISPWAKGIYLMHKQAFDYVGGYDEDFSGNYGYEDTHFFNRCKKLLTVEFLLDIQVSCYLDGRTMSNDRDLAINKKLLDIKPIDICTTPKLRFDWTSIK